jgi:membrane-bound inhibitor of C-type lysozyme
MRPILTLVLTLLPLSAAAETPADGTTLHYICERGAKVDATYLARGQEQLVVVAFEGRQMGFVAYDDTAGIRYLSQDKSHVCGKTTEKAA